MIPKDAMPIGKPSSQPICNADYQDDSAFDDFDGIRVSPWLTLAMAIVAALIVVVPAVVAVAVLR